MFFFASPRFVPRWLEIVRLLGVMQAIQVVQTIGSSRPPPVRGALVIVCVPGWVSLNAYNDLLNIRWTARIGGAIRSRFSTLSRGGVIRPGES
jgi:hypothetical protein